MIVMILLEIIGSGVGVYNLTKGIYNMYTEVGKIKQSYLDYQYYQEIQQKSFDPLTQSQYVCFEEDFEVL